MRENELINLYNKSLNIVRHADTIKERDIFSKIDWDNSLVCILGERGCGKTSLMLWHLNRELLNKNRALYISLDCLEMMDGDLEQVIDEFYDNGVKRFYLDELQYLDKWDIKLNKYINKYPGIKIVYTNTLLLRNNLNKKIKGEKIYSLKGLSFREYMGFEEIAKYNSCSLEDLFLAHKEGARDVAGNIDVKKAFSEYLKRGYYPFYDSSNYYEIIERFVLRILESDFPMIEGANVYSVNRIKRFLAILSKSSPDTPNMSKIYEDLSMDRNLGVKMQNMLIDSGLMHMLKSEDKRKAKTFKPKKIYCFNNDLVGVLDVEADLITREQAFFVNQLVVSGHEVMICASDDFLVDNKYILSVCKNEKKGLDDISNSYYVSNVSVGDEKTIPLWMFGMLY